MAQFRAQPGPIDVLIDSAFAPLDSGRDETVKISIEHVRRIVDLILRAQILDHLVRSQNVATHLVAPARRNNARDLFLRRCLLLALQQKQSRLQHPHRSSTVLNLALLVLAAHHDARRQMSDAHRRVRRIDRLATGTGRAENIDTDVVLGNLDNIRRLDKRNNLDGSETLPAELKGLMRTRR